MRGKFEVPNSGVHPLITRLFRELNIRGDTLLKIEEESGVNHATIRNWRNKHCASLDNIDAVFNVLGYKLTVTKLEGGN